MRKLLFLAITASLFAFSTAQEEPMGGPVSQAYREFREKIVEPPYSITAVKQAIAKLKRDRDDNLKMDPARFNRMSIEQRFTYSMIHGETFSQNCDAMPPFVDEEKKIFSFFPGPFGEEAWSEQQLSFLHKNRTRVLALIKSTMNIRHRLGANMKAAIVELKGKEMIPSVIALYKQDHKDHDILTLLMILMKDGKYKPFTSSQSFTKLYGENASYKAFLMANKANQDLIISRAMGYYRS